MYTLGSTFSSRLKSEEAYSGSGAHSLVHKNQGRPYSGSHQTAAEFPAVFEGHFMSMNIPLRKEEGSSTCSRLGGKLCPPIGIRLLPLLRSSHKNPPPSYTL